MLFVRAIVRAIAVLQPIASDGCVRSGSDGNESCSPRKSEPCTSRFLASIQLVSQRDFERHIRRLRRSLGRESFISFVRGLL